MMLSWMLSASLFGAFVALAAVAAQPFARILGRPTRWLWATALLVASLWPAVAAAWMLLLGGAASVVRLPDVRVVPQGSMLLGRSLPRSSAALDGALLALWSVATLLLLVRLVRSIAAVRRLRERAEPTRVDGVPVLVSDAAGPATVGLRRPLVLLPRELLGIEEPLRRLVVLHEREHCAARDPWFLLGAAAAVALLPWNPALWVIARRLRLALEIDCDARVLATGVDAGRYGRLLLLLASRGGGIALAPTFAAPPTHLERRIIAMRTRLVRPTPLRLAVAATLLVVGIAGACSESAPSPTSRPEVAAVAASPSAPATSSTPAASAVNSPASTPAGRPDVGSVPASSSAPSPAPPAMYEFRVNEQAKQIPGTGSLRYPADMLAARREGEVQAQFVVTEKGDVDISTFRVLKSTDPSFTEAVRAGLQTMKFRPARVNGRAVKQVVEQPFTFGLQKS